MNDVMRRAAAVTLLVLDVDGVLTDGRVYVGPEGERLKVFSMRDGHGIVLARDAGIEIALMTREESPIVRQRAAKLKIEHVIEGSDDKGPAMIALAGRLGRSAEQVAYVGDDVIDLEPMRWAGFAACPADAEPEVREVAHLVATRPGGHGAVREIIRTLLLARGAGGSGL
jgi:3-deoxy-D-manno-octulosonate 8-phosphate phosphatase (KDO 8-P phosphatase)